MRGTIIESWYDEEDGYINDDGQFVRLPATAHLYKETKYGLFYAEAVVAEEDKDVANSWDGFRFAEMKCDIQAYKAKAKIMKERAKGITHALEVVENGNPDIVTTEAFKKLYKQESIAWDNYYKALKHYHTLKNMYHDYCNQIVKQRREFRNK